MSNLIRTYYENAQISDAAYADLAAGMARREYEDALIARGFASLEATEFANSYSIVSTFSDIATGFSATLFQRNGTNEKILAIRGTNDVVDLLTSNLQIGLLGMASQYTSLNTFYLQLIVEGKLSSTDQLTVTGHSLGGYLAQAFTVDHPSPVSHAYTYNAPGFGGVLINPFGSLGVAGTSIPDSLITNIIAQGHSFVASQGRQIGEPENAFIETTLNPLTNHGIRSLVDAVALYDLASRIDPTVSVSIVTDILNAASVTGANSLENGLDALRKVFQGSTVTPTSEDDRNAYYSNLIALRDSLPATSLCRLDSLVEASSSTIYRQANSSTTDGLAYRYALRELNPFAVIGADYSQHNADRSLDLYDAQTGNGTMTALYLSDRAELLAKRLAVNVNDGGSVPTDTHFVDMRTGFEVGSVAAANEVIFGDTQDNRDLLGHAGGDHLYGGEGNDFLIGQGGMDYLEGNAGDDEVYGGTENDTLLGQQGNDELFGEAGNDQLNGGLGNDRLEGGTGLDVYFYRTGQGSDTIADEDRLGIVRFDNTILQGGLHRSTDPANTYMSPDGQFTFVKSGANLVINNTLTIENFDFQNGALGIKLAEVPETTLPAVPIINYDNNGLMSEEINLPASGSWIIERVEAKNYIFSAGQGSYRIYAGPGNDQLYGGPNYDRLSSRSGNDLLQGFGGNDDLYGWEDDDVLQGGDGDDRLYGDLAFEQAGQDYLDGGAGDDLVVGGSGNDVLLGGVGNDMLWGEGGTTELIIIPPGDPNQTGFSFVMDYSLGAGEDTLDGGTGDDSLVGSAGADILLGGDGIDVLYGDHNGGETLMPWDPAKDGEDYLDGGAGNDWLHGGGLADVLIGGSGDDRLFGEGVLYGALGGDDWLEGGEGTDQLYGGLGADALFGGIGDDLLVGDYENEAGSDDMLDGGAGMDELQGGGGNDLLIGGSENDRLFGQDGDDTLSGDAGDDELQGGLGDDDLFGGASNDFLLGQEGADLLDGEEGDDLLKGGDGNDTLFGGDGLDELQGSTGDDQLAGDAGDDFLLGEAGNDTLLGDEGADRLQGGIGDDLISGDAGNDGLFGEEGVDRLLGGDGNDELYGGTGNDILNGETGSDIYLFTPGDGQDQIVEEDVVGEVNTIMFDALITREMLTFTHNPIDNMLLIQVGPTGDSILVHGFTNTGVNGTGGMQNIVADGQSFALADLLGLPSGEIIGTVGNDVIKSGAGNDSIYAGAGNDTITGNAGNDLLVGGAGHDTYTFVLGDGQDTIQDMVTISEGNRIVFGAGISAGTLSYTHSADTLTIAYNGSADTVQLMGFNQNTALGSLVVDTLQFADGGLVNLRDLYPVFTNHAPTVANPVVDQSVSEGTPWSFAIPANTFADGDAGDAPTLSASMADGSAFPAWLNFDVQTAMFSGTPDDAQIGTLGLKVTATDGLNETVSDSFNLTITNVNEAPTVTVPLPDQSATKDVPFNFLVPAGTFADVDPGDSLTYSAALADSSPLPTWLSFNPTTRTFTGTPQFADVGILNVKVTATDTGSLNISDVFALTVAHGLNEIIGTAASETLTGTAGNDLIRGLGGYDTLQGLDGNDTLEGGDGDDQLSGGAGDNTLDGGAGSDRLIVGSANGAGTNVLIGGSGGDRLEGSIGADTLQGGTGNDEIYDNGGENVILFDRGDGQDTIYATAGTIRFAAGVLPTDVTVRGESANYSLVLSINGTTDKMSIFGWLNPFNDYRIERVEFSDGAVWDSSMLRSLANIGTAADDYLGGTHVDEVLSGMGGKDFIEAWDGNDVLDGGTGNDTLRGGLGNDTYLFGRGAGSDLIGDAAGTADKIQLAPGVLPGDITLLRMGTELLLSIDQSPTQLRINNATAIEQITFDNGTIWDAAAIVSHTFIGAVNSMTGTLGNDTFVVDNVQDTVTEGASQGTDTIQSLVSYTLPGNVENLTLTGYFNVDGTGNLSDNLIIGNSGNNKLIGSVNYFSDGGSDTLQGGLGDDNYEVIGNTDTVIEAPNEGIDTVMFVGTWDFGMHYALPDNVENLIAGDGPPRTRISGA